MARFSNLNKIYAWAISESETRALVDKDLRDAVASEFEPDTSYAKNTLIWYKDDLYKINTATSGVASFEFLDVNKVSINVVINELDTKIDDEVAAREKGDTDTLASAKLYVDTKGSIIEHIKVVVDEKESELVITDKTVKISIKDLDPNYIHTDNNYTTSEKEKLAGIEENANNYILPSDVVHDATYVHTDVNFTENLKTAYDEAVNKSHVHENKDLLDSIKEANVHKHDNLETLDKITAEWYEKAEQYHKWIHTHSNMDILNNTTASYTLEQQAKLENIEANAEVNAIETISKNGTQLSIDENKNVNIEVPTGALADKDEVSESELELQLAAKINSVNGKVDKEVGKGLSANDFTDADETKLDGIEAGAQVNAVTSVAGRIGDVVLTKTDVGLSNVNNTSDADKPISTATQSALDTTNTKVDTIEGNLTNEITNRENADTALKESLETKISNETSARETAITDVSDKIDAEITARDTAITEVKGLVTNEAKARSDADTALSTRVSTIEGDYLKAADKTELQGNIDAINQKIPAHASSTNQLADKDFVNSSIASNTANFIGTFDSVEDLKAYSGTLTNNDYGFVKIIDETTKLVKQYDRYKYSTTTTEWKYEYTLNNSSFTAEQWAAINSGITTGKVEIIDTIYSDYLKSSDKTELQTNIDGKVDKVDGKGLSTNDFTDEYKETVLENKNARHTHENKDLLDSYTQTNVDIKDAVDKKHMHSNKDLLDTYDQANVDIKSAVIQKHTHENKDLLDTYTQTDEDLADAVTKKHTHTNKTLLDSIKAENVHSHDNKALLDSYNQTNENIKDAVDKKHSHTNKALLDTYDQTNADIKEAVSDKHTHTNKELLDTYNQSNADIAEAITNTHIHENKEVLDGISEDNIKAWNKGQANIIEEVQVEGKALTITDKSVNVTKKSLGLDKVDNTSDLDKPISTATQSALDTTNTKVDTIEGNLTNEITNRENADTALKESLETKISNETSARETAITDVSDKIDAEITARDTAITEVKGLVTNEAKARSDADTALSTRVSTIEGDYLKAADKTELTELINTEKTRAEGSEKTLQDSITKEISDRASAVSAALVDAKKYTDDYGGKIDVVEVNGVEQKIVEKHVNIIVPTKLTDLTNDGNFVQDANYVHTDNNFEESYVDKVKSVEQGAQVNTVTSVAGKTGDVELDKTDVGLDNVDNTSDIDKPVSTAMQAALDLMRALISSDATKDNPAADKAFVNSSIASNTANYISNDGKPFTSVEQLESYTGELTNNDYAFVVIMQKEQPEQVDHYDRYKYSSKTSSWALEYSLNNSSFTSAQWATINSGITLAMVQELQAALKNHASKEELQTVADGLAAEIARAIQAETDLSTKIEAAAAAAGQAQSDIDIFKTDVADTYSTKDELGIAKSDIKTAYETADAEILKQAKAYTDSDGGKINSVTIKHGTPDADGTVLPISDTKNVDIKIPAALSDLDADADIIVHDSTYSQVVHDANYVHTDVNFTEAYETDLKNNTAWIAAFKLPDNIVQDANYVHTDHNLTDAILERIPSESLIVILNGTEVSYTKDDKTRVDNSIQEGDSRLSDARTPLAHTHTKEDITDFAHKHTKEDITDFVHTHTKADITDFAHTHTKDEITDFAHTHLKSEITDFAHTHTKSEITDFAHTHNHEDISDWADATSSFLVASDIAGKANSSDVYSKTETYTKTEVDDKIDAAKLNVATDDEIKEYLGI